MKIIITALALALVLIGCGGTTAVPPGVVESAPSIPNNTQDGELANGFLDAPPKLEPVGEIAKPQSQAVQGSDTGISVVPNQSVPTGEIVSQPDGSRSAPSLTLPPGVIAGPSTGWAEEQLRAQGFDFKGKNRTVVLDPGHGGPEVGAAFVWASGAYIREKDLNLKIALNLKRLLEADGFRVVMTRTTDDRAYTSPPPEAGASGFSSTRVDLQARVDIANDAGADIFVSIHNNGSTNPSSSGTFVFYDAKRPFATLNRLLAESVQGGLIEELRAVGHTPVDLGVKDSSQFRVFNDRSFSLFVLGAPREAPRASRATQMPGILGESLFVSNPTEAALLSQDRGLEAIAQGYRKGIQRYFQSLPSGS